MKTPIDVLRSYLSDGEAPCYCAGTVDGDQNCPYCTLKEEAREALEKISEDEYSKGYDAGAEAMRAAIENWACDYFGSVPPTLKARIKEVTL